jgi:hypothetical protein
MKIHTFGDSHCIKYSWKKLADYCHKLGPRLMYSVGRDGINILDISKKIYKIKNDDIVVFSFGEVDCRNRIKKYITEDKSYQDAIEDIVKSYFNVLRLNIINLQNKNINVNVLIYNVIPPVRSKDVPNNPTYPYNGSDEERKNYHLYMNEMLKKYTKIEGWTFFDIYDHYCDKDGFLNRHFAKNNDIHLNLTPYFKKKLDQYINEISG